MVTLGAERVHSLRRELQAAREAGHLRTRLEPFPSTARARWSIRAAFAAPFLAIAMISAAPTVSSITVNQTTVDHVSTLAWDRADVAWISQLYPPLGTVLVRLIPGGTAGLAVVGALVAGVLLQLLLEVMVQRRFEWWKSAVFLVAIGANPLFAYTATGNFEAFLSIAFFGIGAINMVRFVSSGNTKAGFEAGILFMLAALADASGLVLVVAAAITAPLLSVARRAESGARWSNVLIVLFPTIAVIGAVMFLQLLFGRDPLSVFENAVHYDPALLTMVPHLFTSLDGVLILAPVVSGSALALLSRRPGSILIAVFVFAALVFGYVFGLIPENSAGNVFLIMTMMGIAVIPAARTVRASVLITVVGAAQVVIAWTAAVNRPITLSWMSAIAHALGWR
jgi:hypothetical protein